MSGSRDPGLKLSGTVNVDESAPPPSLSEPPPHAANATAITVAVIAAEMLLHRPRAGALLSLSSIGTSVLLLRVDTRVSLLQALDGCLFHGNLGQSSFNVFQVVGHRGPRRLGLARSQGSDDPHVVLVGCGRASEAWSW